ncbi:MAG: IS200/IS605 family transposase, partial [Halobacteria archaeon]
YHYVWTPKYRHKILEKVEENLEKWIQKIAKNNDYKIISLHISPDHIHLFLSTHPKHSPSEIIHRIKSITARKLWENHEQLMEQYFWGGGCWETSYYIGTAGEVSSDTIQKYIERIEHV